MGNLYSSDFAALPLCDMFGGYCFDEVIATDKYYRECKTMCFDDCQGVDLITLKSYVPIDQFEVCKEDGLIYQHVEQYLKQELDLENYRTMIAG